MSSTDFPFGYNLSTSDAFQNYTADDVFAPERGTMPSYPHEVIWCSLCQCDTVICGKCRNNCCNGGHGTLPDGTECGACLEAYKLQDKMWEEQEINAR